MFIRPQILRSTFNSLPRSYLPITKPVYFHSSRTWRMPESLKAEEVNSKTDPSVAKQWDDESSTEKKFEVRYNHDLHSALSPLTLTGHVGILQDRRQAQDWSSGHSPPQRWP